MPGMEKRPSARAGFVGAARGLVNRDHACAGHRLLAAIDDARNRSGGHALAIAGRGWKQKGEKSKNGGRGTAAPLGDDPQLH